MFRKAIARRPGPDCGAGITTAGLGRPDYELLLRQHSTYLEALSSTGLELTVLEPLEGFPDAWFVEDTAVVTPDVAVITNPGAPSRRGEEDSIGQVLASHRTTVRIKYPGTLDGGDVLMIGRHFLIGLSKRTNREGAVQLGTVLERFGNTWTTVQVGDGLHLKSSVNFLGGETLLVAGRFVDAPEISGYEKIVLDPAEAYAANVLTVNGRLIVPAGFPDTRDKLVKIDPGLIELDVSEVRKMDGGLTCMSIRF